MAEWPPSRVRVLVLGHPRGGVRLVRIEFRYWPGNTEVVLIEDIGDWPRVKRSFYTSAKRMGVAETINGVSQAFDATFYFELLEEIAPLPILGGQFGHLHPYWSDHPKQAVRMRMEHKGITEQDIAETMPPRQGEAYGNH